MSPSTTTRSTVVPPEEFEKVRRLEADVYKGEVGRTWIEDVETLPTHAIAVLIVELRRHPQHSLESLEAARRAAEIVAQDRLARQQIEAEERLTQELIETQKRLAEQGKTLRWVGGVVALAAGVVTVTMGIAALL